MQKKILEFNLANDDGSPIVIYFEVTDALQEQQGARATANESAPPLKKAEKSFEEAISILKPASRAVVNAIKGLQPDSTEIELGIKMDARFGIVFASSKAEANFKIKLTWKKDQTEEDKKA